QVMSAGLSEPLTTPRQYRKNIGRELDLLLTDTTKIEGELAKVDDDKITLILRYRKPKEVGKGKVDVVEEKEIPYTEIKKALVTIKF
ncbi:MAG TPA: ribosome assembly cofactor RimP, partial [Chryseobacterium sp.]|nr:ribosome assembly cofactor RimP [Chryseobacterium sp.]